MNLECWLENSERMAGRLVTGHPPEKIGIYQRSGQPRSTERLRAPNLR